MLRILFLLFLVISGLFTARILYDEKLTPEAQVFFTAEPIDIEKNFYIRFSGLHAPIDDPDYKRYGERIYAAD